MVGAVVLDTEDENGPLLGEVMMVLWPWLVGEVGPLIGLRWEELLRRCCLDASGNMVDGDEGDVAVKLC